MSTDCLSSVGAKSLYFTQWAVQTVGMEMLEGEGKDEGQKVILIDKAPCGLGCGLLTPYCVFVVGYQTAALKALKTDRRNKTVKSMIVSHRLLQVLPNHLKWLPWHLYLHLPPLKIQHDLLKTQEFREAQQAPSALKQQSMTDKDSFLSELRASWRIKQLQRQKYNKFQPVKDEDDEECKGGRLHMPFETRPLVSSLSLVDF